MRAVVLPSLADKYEEFSSKEDPNYYYVLLPPGNSGEFERMEKLIAAAEIPCEVSESPSNWRCYRVHHKHQDRLIPMEPGSGRWHTDFGLPAGFTYGMWKKRERVWRMYRSSDMQYLFKNWRVVYAEKRVRSREATPAPTTIRQRVRKNV